MRQKRLILTIILLLPFSFLRAQGIVESAQQALKDQGFYYGEVNGQKTAETTAAIRRYQIRNGLTVNGELDADTKRSLGLTSNTGEAKAAPSPADRSEDLRDDNALEERHGLTAPTHPPMPGYPPQAAAPPSDEFEPREGLSDLSKFFEGTPYEIAPPAVQERVISSAQTLLIRNGCYHGEIDGTAGPGTELALRAYQAQIGLPITGRFEMATLAALRLLPGQHLPPPHRIAPRLSRPIYRGEWIREYSPPF